MFLPVQRSRGRYATESEAWEAHDDAMATQSDDDSEEDSPKPQATPAKKARWRHALRARVLLR